MPESSTNVEPKGKNDNVKERNSASQNKHIEANVEVDDGAVGTKNDLHWVDRFVKTRLYSDVSAFIQNYCRV